MKHVMNVLTNVVMIGVVMVLAATIATIRRNK